ncbi:HNH endonuclease [Priestia megaterium]|uniref:HNH endonuclease n=1 Tax=Priestia megaterium TaxID=1404 RepID=UPI002E1F0474|nr:HNH endonuclease [Priestia megaterium]
MGIELKTYIIPKKYKKTCRCALFLYLINHKRESLLEDPRDRYKGSISIENNGTWTYTNKSGTSVSYPNGYPDLPPFMHPNVKPVKIEVHSPKNNPKDFENENKAARLTKDTDPPIIDIRRPPDGYTWHYHEDGKTMMLVDEDIHREFRQIGGQSKVNGKNK